MPIKYMNLTSLKFENYSMAPKHATNLPQAILHLAVIYFGLQWICVIFFGFFFFFFFGGCRVCHPRVLRKEKKRQNYIIGP